ncbi:TRAF-like family protein [Euphorbia peplus]|nr:TRAF-like family protein [Euphorbia peplus]
MLLDQQSPAHDDQTAEVIRELRDVPPLHYLFKIKNFSLFSTAMVDHYESTDFELGAYKWKLSLHPKGNKKVNETTHISLYLLLSESNSFPFNREITVNLKMFVYNQIQDNYLAVQDAKGRVMRFRGMKIEHGFDQLIPLNVFNDASNGYLINDCCIFGAEIFVLEGSSICESASLKQLGNNSYTWEIENFGEMENDIYLSEVFVIGGYQWAIELHPNGYEKERGKSLSLYLNLEDWQALDSGHSLYVEYVLRMKDEVQGKHHEQSRGGHFSSSVGSCGFSKFMPLSQLNDNSQGYMINGALILQVEISLITKVKRFS